MTAKQILELVDRYAAAVCLNMAYSGLLMADGIVFVAVRFPGVIVWFNGEIDR